MKVTIELGLTGPYVRQMETLAAIKLHLSNLEADGDIEGPAQVKVAA